MKTFTITVECAAAAEALAAFSYAVEQLTIDLDLLDNLEVDDQLPVLDGAELKCDINRSA